MDRWTTAAAAAEWRCFLMFVLVPFLQQKTYAARAAKHAHLQYECASQPASQPPICREMSIRYMVFSAWLVNTRKTCKEHEPHVLAGCRHMPACWCRPTVRDIYYFGFISSKDARARFASRLHLCAPSPKTNVWRTRRTTTRHGTRARGVCARVHECDVMWCVPCVP